MEIKYCPNCRSNVGLMKVYATKYQYACGSCGVKWRIELL